ncbi:glycosyl hydrolase 31 family [Rhizoctonia solani]|uniref:Glycosyl hydrolase 31 family n=1 Tax=Rhizoctonia solani TaxID=456999 RepID=A0A8H7HFX0_9AGAM|nr:glycosyl hydrolase 31 family [Rhizoctonia solani]
MPRHHIPVGFRRIPQPSQNTPVFLLNNDKGHKFSVHPITHGLVRVVHELPEKYKSRWGAGIQWESVALSLPEEPEIIVQGDSRSTLSTKSLKISIDWSDGCPRLQWFSTLPGRKSPDEAPFLSDCRTRAYTYDAATGGVLHYVEREEWLPVSEHEPSPACPLGQDDEPFVNDRRNEYVYGLGEASGGILRTARKFTLEARDGAGYDWENGDPLYKVTPFYIIFNKKTGIWCGVYYNSLANDASIDFGAECDALFNGFRTYRAGCGPLDYYVILGDGTLPSVISTYASLVSPSTSNDRPEPSSQGSSVYPKAWRASLTLPPRSQFGYLASSLALAAEPHAQDAVLDFVKICRKKGFPIDALHLSTGWCQHPDTDNRHYFVWNRQRYPDPHALGTALEQEMNIRIIVNIKPWLLDDHPLYDEALKQDAYVRAAEDAPDPDIKVAKSLLWSNAPGEHMYGSYLDFSSPGAVEWWSRHIKEDIVGMNMTGMWIDNNEFSGLVDDAEVYVGRESFWVGGEWESRLGWGGGETTVGQAGRLIQMMGMAKTTYDTMLGLFPDRRPIIVTRAAIPGMQAYAHVTTATHSHKGTWSGDNATSWIALRRGTAMTLSAGISFLPGLYGHDIGGFAGKHHPSPELLGAWHTRFTVHSWKELSTTLWMYDGVEMDGVEITGVLRDVLAFRYQIIPTMYSLYVNEYWKQGWPVLRPMFWYHSADPRTLALDEQFLFGSHILVAPVLSFSHRTKRVYLPGVVDGTDEVPEWCELDTGIWHTSPSNGGFIHMDAPLSRTPALVRAGGILVLSNKCAETVYDGEATRVAHIFPSLNSESNGATGSFKLVEDDGKTNEHAEKGIFTELEISFQVNPGEKGKQEVQVDVKELNSAYPLPYTVIWFILPPGDGRKLKAAAGSTRKTSDQKSDDARVMLGLHLN